MNREIKFRAWSKETEKMSDWDFINSVRNLHKLMTLNHIELMQFTGLTDKNGKEIYEGDIIVCSYFKMSVGENFGATEVDAELKGIIEFNDLSLCVTNIVGEKWSHYTGYSDNEGSCEITYLHDVYEGSTDAEMSIEVIGNIYENSNLLQDVA